MNIVIWAEGGEKIGLGHIMRSLVLAIELRKKHEVFFVSRYSITNPTIYSSGMEKISEDNFFVIKILEENFYNDFIKIAGDILIVDSYQVSDEFFRKVKNNFRKIVYIDDQNLFDFEFDIIINQNINAKDLKYKDSKIKKLLLGTKYAMIREEFRKPFIRKINEVSKDILITLGGSDPVGFTQKIIDWIIEKQLNILFRFHIVVGSAFANKQELMKINVENIFMYSNPNMSNLMKKFDFAISSCGSTLYEMCVTGTPTLGISIADNQDNIGQKMGESNVINFLGKYQNIEKERFCSELVDLANDYKKRQQMSKTGKELIDGKGCERIVANITMLSEANLNK